MRLNPFAPKDDPMYESLFCFGGGPGGGGEGGGMSGSGGPPQSGGSRSSSNAGNIGVGSGAGLGASSDGRDRSGGSGSDGGNDNNNQQDRQAYSDRFGGVSTRNFNVDTNQGFVDTDKGRVYGSSEDLSKGIAEGDISPTERQDTAIGMASDIMGVDRSNVALGGDLFFGEEDVLANQDLSFGSGAAAGPALSGDAVSFTPTPVTSQVSQPAPELTPEVAQIASGILDQAVPGRVAEGVRADPVMGGSLFMDDIDIFDPTRPDLARDPSQPAVSIRAATPADQVLAQARGMTEADYAAGLAQSLDQPFSVDVDAARAQQVAEDQAMGMSQFGVGSLAQAAREVELETGVPASQVAGIVGLTGPAATTSRTPQEMALTGSQTFDVQPSVQGTFDPRISAGVMSDSPQQFDLEQMQLANDLIARSTAAANRTPVTLDRAMQKDREGYFSPGEYEIADTNQFQEQPEDQQIYGGRGIATPQAATLTDAERMSQQGVDAEMTGIPIGATAERREIAGQDPRAPDYTLAEAQANLEAARAEAYRDKQFGFDTGLPSSVNIFGAQVPTGVGLIEGIADALLQPDASLANAMSQYGIRTIDGNPVPKNAANYNPQGLDVVTAGGPIGEGGRTAAYDARGNVVYDSAGMMDRIGDIFTGGTPENIEELYARQRTIDEQQREMQGGGDGGQQILPPPVEQPPEAPVVDDQGRVLVQPYQYQQRGPISYAYTGLPSLAPTRLRPSYQASKRFSPLFPVS